MLKTKQLLWGLWKPMKITTRRYPYPPQFQYYLQNLPEAKCTVMPNGMTVVTEERECYNACIGLFYDAGSRYENAFENGIAHFIEHIAFKSTKCRQKTVLEDIMSSTGARFRCFTTRELVGYYIECLCQDIPLCVDLLSDCIYNNSFVDTDLETQKQIVYAEMVEHDQNSRGLLYDYLHSTAFQGTPLAQTVMGISTNLINFNADTISRYLQRCFVPTKTVFVAVGGIKHEQTMNFANSYLNLFETSKCYDGLGYRFTGSEVRFRNDALPVAHVAVAVEAPSMCHPDSLVLQVAANIVGGWDRSQGGGADHAAKVARAASSAHLCDAYKAFNITYKDTGLWGVEFLAPAMQLDDMLYHIQSKWMFLCTIVRDAEVERAKHHLKSKILSKMESCTDTCIDLGRWYLYNGNRATVSEMLGSIDKIFSNNVKEVCSKYIYDKCPAVAAVGATEGLMDYTRIRAGMYWLRL